ncbi:MAG: hypothetical protein RJA44_2395 [Pseudomonadota bacterium]|jgi:two-component system OmpR family response regulator/two-component system response regulator QseB
MRILVVEDDEGIAQGLSAKLAQQGYGVDAVNSLNSAWTALCAQGYDLLLLDLGLPDGDGATLLQRLRAASAASLPDAHMPVLIMTARDTASACISGLELGADDYVTKPFNADVLVARVRALLRRSGGPVEQTIRCGTLLIDPNARTVQRDGQPIELSSREFAVLLALAQMRPRVLTRPQIEERIYNLGAVVDSNTVEVHVHHLRRKLGDQVIRTMRGVGYFMPAETTA